MKAFIVDRYGRGGNNVRVGDMPVSEVGEHDALDSKIRDGESKLVLPYRLPIVLGNDVGVVRSTQDISNPATRSASRIDAANPLRMYCFHSGPMSRRTNVPRPGFAVKW